jgi:cell division protein FtsQ
MPLLPWRRKIQAAYRQAAPTGPPLWLLPALKIMVVLGVVALLWTTLVWLARPSTLPVRHVKVSGAENGRSVALRYVNSSAVEKALAELLPEGMIWLSPPALERALESLPWVKQARSQRLWPDRVHIVLHEYVPLARWQSGARACMADAFCALLDADGQPFYVPAMQVPAGLPLLRGAPGNAAQVLSKYMALQEIAQQAGTQIVRLHMDARQALSLELNQGLRLTLGIDHSVARLRRFFRVYPIIARDRENAQIHHIDLRYPNGIVVQWQGLAANQD